MKREMGMNFSNDIIDEIKSKCNIVDVVGAVVPIKKAGANFKGNCPFHNEKTASFVVSEQKQIFSCFGCGATGDVIEFVKKYYNLDFMGAIEKLASDYGIEIKQSNSSNSKERDLFYTINREAALYYVNAFYANGNPGYTYMINRGLNNKTLKIFGIGYADGNMTSLKDYLNSKGYDDRTLFKIGLISEKNGKYYDKFRDRVMFPIINTSSKVIGFGGRAIGDAEPKYLNSPESPIFLKKNNLYALNTTRSAVSTQNQAILVEGYMDVISLYQGGIENVAASLGTALTDNQAKLLKRYTKNIVLSYDADSAGQKAALRGGEILYKAEMKVKILHVTEGKDPDEFIKKKGKLAFLELIKNAPSYADYRINHIKNATYQESTEGRVEFMKSVADFLQELNPAEQDIYIKKIAKEMGFSEEALKRQVLGAKITSEKTAHFSSRSEKTKDAQVSPSNIEKDLIKLLLLNTSFYDEIINHESIFTSKPAMSIIEAIKEQIEKGYEIVDTKIIADSIEDSYVKILENIEKNVLIADEKKTLHDCLIKAEIEKCKLEMDQIMTMMSMADSIGDTKKADELLKSYSEIKAKEKDLKHRLDKLKK